MTTPLEESPAPALGKRSADAQGRALAYAGLTFATVAPLTYATERILERLRAPVADPGLVLLSTHMGFVWRALVATWFGVATAALVFLSLRDGRSPGIRARSFGIALVVIGVLVATAAVALP